MLSYRKGELVLDMKCASNYFDTELNNVNLKFRDGDDNVK